jgi:hypothetical protein
MSVTDFAVILVVVAGYVFSIWVIAVFIGNRRLQRIEHRIGRVEAQLMQVSRQLADEFVDSEP